MFSKKTRKGFVGGVALALAGVMAGEAGAADAALASGKNRAILIDEDVCENVNVSIAVAWANANDYGKDLFFMTGAGAVYNLNTTKYLHDYKDFMVFSHGNDTQIGPNSNEDFAEHFYMTQDKAPDSVFFKSCEAGVAPAGEPSLLRYMQLQFKNEDGWTSGTKGIGVLSGPPGGCQLVPSTVMRYAGAEVRTGAVSKDNADFGGIPNPVVRQAFQTIADGTIFGNVSDKWTAQGAYAADQNYKTTCQALVADVKNKKQDLVNFISEVIREFGQEDVVPANNVANMLTSYSYDKGGVANVTCGRAADCPSNE